MDRLERDSSRARDIELTLLVLWLPYATQRERPSDPNGDGLALAELLETEQDNVR